MAIKMWAFCTQYDCYGCSHKVTIEIPELNDVCLCMSVESCFEQKQKFVGKKTHFRKNIFFQ